VNDEALFIVDNSVSGRTGAGYLGQWCEIANRFDIATGYFEIGALLELDGRWQQLDEIRILMGDEVTQRTKKALTAAAKRELTATVRDRTELLINDGLESDKLENPFLTGVEAIVEALESGKIKCRVYNQDKFHAKAYITHGRLEAVGSQALVGSSNFTRPGLTQNVELNIKLESSSEVSHLQNWYEEHWQMAEDVTPDILRVVARHTHEYTPFDVWVRALTELFAGRDESAGIWEQGTSKLFDVLDRYQKEAYWKLIDIAKAHGGAFLCDGVGLGKTFVGLMLIERMILMENKRVLLFAPKATREAVWDKELKKRLPHVGTRDFNNLAVFNHTDLTRSGDFPERFKKLADLADAIIIDEAHHFRNRGTLPDPDEPDKINRYYRMLELLDGSVRPKQVFLLTATPINNGLTDFKHMIELFSRGDDTHFSQTLGVTNLTARFRELTRKLREVVEAHGDLATGADIDAVAAVDVLQKDPLFEGLVVQRSRAYAKRSQELEGGEAAQFPVRDSPQVASYSIARVHAKLLKKLEAAFEKENPLFKLPIYYPLDYYTGDDEEIAPFDWGRQEQVVSLIRTSFLKRFESSVYAFEQSCDRLMRKLLAFVEIHSETDAQQSRLNRWKTQNNEILGYVQHRQEELFPDDDEDDDEDLIPEELLESVEHLNSEEFDVESMLAETFLDLDQLVDFLEETEKVDPEKDDKLQQLIELLGSDDLANRKVAIFTEYAATARYLRQQLVDAGIDGVFQLDGGTKTNRRTVIERFAPYYNGRSSADLVEEGDDEIRVLISTDVLSEGLNLQDACRLINYDIHWNPVRLIQRIGRVDRRLDLEIEARIIDNHPDSGTRGFIRFWNFLPPKELNRLLSLYRRVTGKIVVISETLGIEAGKLLQPDDDFNVLKEFNAGYEGEASAAEELELELQALLTNNPGLEERIASQPKGVFSGREHPPESSTGVFFCYRLPALDSSADADSAEFTLDSGTTRWYLFDLETEQILETPGEIAAHVRSCQDTPRTLAIESTTLVSIRDKVRKHIKNSYEKAVGLPANAPSPQLRCWMELN